MSKIALQGNVSGTGTISLVAPNTSTDRTLTLPDAAGTLDRLERAGNVLQVVYHSDNTQYSLSIGSVVSLTTLAASITPTSTSSKILVNVELSYWLVGNNAGLQFYIDRNGTTIWQAGASYELYQTLTSGTLGDLYHRASWTYQDSPSTTSSVTYTPQVNRYNGGTTAGINYATYFTSTITLMEIAG